MKAYVLWHGGIEVGKWDFVLVLPVAVIWVHQAGRNLGHLIGRGVAWGYGTSTLNVSIYGDRLRFLDSNGEDWGWNSNKDIACWVRKDDEDLKKLSIRRT
ncbi:hypothetical protein [Rubritalea tangerina]|uniref:hypothetical protein n=1 Tax=Rubritalea tangerina TaxID=430798 RepID=UPI003615B4D7